MAGDPLDFLSPDEFDNFRKTGGYGANPAPQNEAGRINDAYNQVKARLSAARGPAASVGGTGPAPSIPVGDNVAPVSTASAASKPSFGQRLISGARGTAASIAKGGLALAPVAGALGAVTAPQSEVKDLADSFGVDYDSFGGRVLANGANFLKKTGDAATLGLATPLGEGIARVTNGGSFFKPYQPEQPQATAPTQQAVAPEQPQATAPTQQAVAPTQNPNVTQLSGDAAAKASTFIDGTGVPASGTGFIRNNTTGAVTQLTSPQPVQQRGTPGGAFGFYTNFANNYAKAAASVSERNRGEKLQQRAALINLENAKAAAAFKPVVQQGLDGRPVVVDPRTKTATTITPTQRPSLQQYKDAVRKDPRGANRTETQLENDYNTLVNNGQL